MNTEKRLAAYLLKLRQQHKMSLDTLATNSGISKATLSRMENASTSPTASQLNSLCNIYGITLSQLMYDAESGGISLFRAAQMPEWTDPQSGYQRRLLSPPANGFNIELLEIKLPAGALVQFAKPPLPGLEQHLVMQQGCLQLTLDTQHFELHSGDAIRFKLFGTSQFHNPGKHTAQYLLAVGNP
ncbi:helix-turn-helix domain-containing protein [Bowmanella yangjiangensis]|uniref:Helix-turn-helix transcriptional regulator n=1 Tax=Bowmanella yangjiangensis TaxID=2811230 RepID=A0ABS3CQS8_9ALTE|nr:XRE family transcriptional regulator [Bowmanella yangjiangensis]MBN7819447.1 helix-turn-helix transcriptional regulator [Bowmanella yangjiangensis]